MNKIKIITRLASLPIIAVGSVSAADVWTTGVSEPTDGAFGTPGSVSGNSIAASLGFASVSFSSDLPGVFRTTSAPNVTNNQLVPFFENEEPLVNFTFASNIGISDFQILTHNIFHQNTTEAGTNVNYLGNFRLTFAGGEVITNAIPTISNIGVSSEFLVDGTDLQPTGLNSAFDTSNILSLTTIDPDGAGAAVSANYLFDPSDSNPQGAGILSFDETLGSGGITNVEMVWVGNTVNSNTAFFGFAGTTVPEPASAFLTLLGGAFFFKRKRVA